jgi:hypothetical protein
MDFFYERDLLAVKTEIAEEETKQKEPSKRVIKEEDIGCEDDGFEKDVLNVEF